LVSGRAINVVCFAHYSISRVAAIFIIPAKAREYVFTGVGLCVCVCVCVSVCDHDN